VDGEVDGCREAVIDAVARECVRPVANDDGKAIALFNDDLPAGYPRG